MSSSRYARMSNDEGEAVGMVRPQSKAQPAYSAGPSQSKKTPLWKYAAGAAVFTALLIPAVSMTSSVMLDYRVAKAVQEAKPLAVNATASASTLASVESEIAKPEPVKAVVDPSNPSAGQTYEMRDCGSNADEARANGCEYDVMMQEWTPPACIDWALSEKFLEAGNWTWYADAGAEKIYNATEIALGNHDVVYVDQSYHRHHCIFTWERLVRAMRTQRPLIEKLVNYDHVMHCRMNTLKTFEEGAEPVRGVVAPTAFTKCASYDVWLREMPANHMSSVDRLVKRFEEEYNF